MSKLGQELRAFDRQMSKSHGKIALLEEQKMSRLIENSQDPLKDKPHSNCARNNKYPAKD